MGRDVIEFALFNRLGWLDTPLKRSVDSHVHLVRFDPPFCFLYSSEAQSHFVKQLDFLERMP